MSAMKMEFVLCSSEAFVIVAVGRATYHSEGQDHLFDTITVRYVEESRGRLRGRRHKTAIAPFEAAIALVWEPRSHP
jgi:hypothetical protein